MEADDVTYSNSLISQLETLGCYLISTMETVALYSMQTKGRRVYGTNHTCYIVRYSQDYIYPPGFFYERDFMLVRASFKIRTRARARVLVYTSVNL